MDAKIRFGIRLHVIVRETNDEAWQAAERLISHLDDETIAKAQAAFARTDSVGQQRMAALHNGKRDNLEISPQFMGGRWLSARRCRDGTGGRWSDGRCANQRIRRAWHRQLCAFRATRIWKKRIGLASCCSRIWMSPSRKFPQPQPLNPQGEAVANDFIPP